MTDYSILTDQNIKEFEVEICQKAIRRVNVKAESLIDAIFKIKAEYYRGDIELLNSPDTEIDTHFRASKVTS